jgi:pyridoxal phosphate enzyme (YggS family)
MNVKENLIKIKNELPPHVKLIVVTKTKPVEIINEIISCGHYYFGENKVQELVAKATKIADKVEWHMIGHLQTNKVKKLLPYVSLIHSLDSMRLAIEINKEAQKINKIIPCLLQIHIAKEETKFGFNEKELQNFLESPDFKNLNNIKICGLMGMATLTEDENLIRSEFKYLRNLFEFLKQNYFSNNPEFKELSMGMSNDYKIAIDEGSTMVRLGSIIVGERNY